MHALQYRCGDPRRRAVVGERWQVEIAGLYQAGAGGQFVEWKVALVVELVGGAPAGIEQCVFRPGGAQALLRDSQVVAVALHGRVAVSERVAGHLDDVRFVTHETAEGHPR